MLDVDGDGEISFEECKYIVFSIFLSFFFFSTDMYPSCEMVEARQSLQIFTNEWGRLRTIIQLPQGFSKVNDTYLS